MRLIRCSTGDVNATGGTRCGECPLYKLVLEYWKSRENRGQKIRSDGWMMLMMRLMEQQRTTGELWKAMESLGEPG